MSDVDRWKTELIAGGFRPQRFGFLVRNVRRLLWPFIRPFHFYMLDVMGRLFDESQRQAEAYLKSGIERVVAGQSTVRTELAAVVHRHTTIEGEIGRAVDGQSALRTDLAAVLDRLTAIEAESEQSATRLRAISERFNSAERLVGGVADRLGKIDHRTKLFLAHTCKSLLILKEGEYISDTAARTGVWDQHIVDVIDEVAGTRPNCAVDVGAHFGLLTVVMAKRFERVISFEPNLFNFSMLTANIVLNRLANVQCISSAVYSQDAELSLGRPSQQEVKLPLDAIGRFDALGSDNLGAFMFTEDGSGVFPSRAVTLDSLELDDLSFLKIDVQGADGQVIKGAIKTIRRCRPVIVFEWEALLSLEFEVTLDAVRALLLDAGYTLDVLKVHNEKQTDYVARPRSL
jgi:FkbM family methyltransferase